MCSRRPSALKYWCTLLLVVLIAPETLGVICGQAAKAPAHSKRSPKRRIPPRRSPARRAPPPRRPPPRRSPSPRPLPPRPTPAPLPGLLQTTTSSPSPPPGLGIIDLRSPRPSLPPPMPDIASTTQTPPPYIPLPGYVERTDFLYQNFKPQLRNRTQLSCFTSLTVPSFVTLVTRVAPPTGGACPYATSSTQALSFTCSASSTVLSFPLATPCPGTPPGDGLSSAFASPTGFAEVVAVASEGISSLSPFLTPGPPPTYTMQCPPPRAIVGFVVGYLDGGSTGMGAAGSTVMMLQGVLCGFTSV